MRKITLFLFCLLTAAGGGSALAGEPVHELDKVVVTATRMDETKREVTQNVTIIPEDVIRNSTADGVADLLKHYGIQTTWTGSPNYGNEGVVIRGGKSSMHGFDLAGDVLMLVDGRRVGSDNLSVLGLNNIERIEIIRGPGAVQYGSAAIGGVINVITKRGKEKPEVVLEAGGGSYDNQRYKAFASGRAGKLDMAAWGSYASGHDIKDGEGERVDNSGMNHMVKYGFNAGWNFNERHRLGVSLQGMDAERLRMGPETGRGASRYTQDQNRDYNLLDIAYEGETEDQALAWLARYYFGKTSYDLNRTRSTTKLRGKYSDNENKIQGGQAQLTFAGLERLRLVGGVDMLYYDMEQNQVLGDFTNANQANYTDSEYLNLGAFLMGKLYLLENNNLIFSAGGRYDHFSIDTKTDYAPGTGRYQRTKNDPSVDNFAPSVGLAYNPWEFLKVRANYSHAFRMPTPRQLGGQFAMGSSTTYVGNPDLEPEESRSWDLGFDVDYGALDFTVTYFRTRYKDMITYERIASNPTVNRYINKDKADVNGFEGGVSFDFGERLNWAFILEPYFYATHLTKFEDDDGQAIAGVARNSFSWGLRFNHPGVGLAASFDVTYFDRRDDTPGGASVADLSVVQRVWASENAGELKVKFALNNIFDKYYTTENEDYMPGRNFYLGLVYNY